MEKFIVNGPCRLSGEINVSGAKNAAVAIIPATLLVKGKCHLENVPDISDIRAYFEILKSLGSKIEFISKNEVIIDNENVNTAIASYELTSKFRASYYLIGALIGRFDDVQISLPGGCNLGARPIDQHIKGFERLGATVTVEKGTISAKAKKLTGNSIYMDIVSVGATINVMLSAVLAKGTTTIDNAAKEPHIVDVANFLNTMGADIRGAGTDMIKINGVEKLSGNATYSVVPDQIEAGTFMLAAVATRGDILINGMIKLNEEIKKYLLNIVKHMGIEDAKIETKVRENMPIFNIVTEVTILIGKGGRTIDALQVVANQMVLSNINNQYRFLIDVNEYKQQKNKRLEKMAKYTAKEVARTGVSVNLDPMNSYQRRMIHNALTKFDYIETISEGEEPNRCIVIKYKEKDSE